MFERYGAERLVLLLVRAYPHLRRSEGRSALLFSLPRFARSHPAVIDLAVGALADRAFLVREYACAILAYSLQESAIPALESLATHPHAETRASSEAAIDAIRSKNHHYYVDREHSGNTFWQVRPTDIPRV
jgi:hypothetical protein